MAEGEPADEPEAVKPRPSKRAMMIVEPQLLVTPRDESMLGPASSPPQGTDDEDDGGGCCCFGGGAKPQDKYSAGERQPPKTAAQLKSSMRRRMSAGSAACVTASPEALRNSVKESLKAASRYAEDQGHMVSNEDSSYHGVGATRREKKKKDRGEAAPVPTQ